MEGIDAITVAAPKPACCSSIFPLLLFSLFLIFHCTIFLLTLSHLFLSNSHSCFHFFKLMNLVLLFIPNPFSWPHVHEDDFLFFTDAIISSVIFLCLLAVYLSILLYSPLRNFRNICCCSSLCEIWILLFLFVHNIFTAFQVLELSVLQIV